MSTTADGFTERTLMLPCEGERLLGVLAEPKGGAATDVGVVIVVGGPQYRAGSHRQFVHLARALASAGTPTLRYDVRGMGDSTGEPRSFEQLGVDTRAAIDTLTIAVPCLQRIVLWGLCDGASAALLYLHEMRDGRVHGLCLVNPWVRSEASLARTHVKHYYRNRLTQRSFWMKLVGGRVAGKAVRDLWSNIRTARDNPTPKGPALNYQARMASAWNAFRGPILLVLSGNDTTAQEFSEYTAKAADWNGLITRALVGRHEVPEADHTLSRAEHRRNVEQATQAWMARTGQ